MSKSSAPTNSSAFNVAELKSFATRYYLQIVIGVIAVAVVYATALPDRALMDPLSTRNIVRILLIGAFFILVIFANHNRYQVFKVTNSIMVPVTVVLILLYIWFDAWGADELSREDKVIEDLSFFFLMIGAACLAVVAIYLIRKREFVTAALSVLGAAVFFVIGMEEISWFQRVLEVESTEFFLNRNSQGETNFHNIYTHESEDIYYLGGFLFLVLLPYFRESLARFFDQKRFSIATILLPPAWLIAPFALAGAFVSQSFASRAANVTIVVGTLIVLIGLMCRHYQQREWGSLAQVVSSFAITLIAVVMLLGMDFISVEVRPWIGKEYQEFYIAWGLAAYGVSVLFQAIEFYREPAISESSA